MKIKPEDLKNYTFVDEIKGAKIGVGSDYSDYIIKDANNRLWRYTTCMGFPSLSGGYINLVEVELKEKKIFIYEAK